MKLSKRTLTLAGLVLTAHLFLGACQANQEPKDTASTNKVKVADHKLEKAKSYIVVAEIQEDGYVLVHGNHYHFEKKPIPHDAKFLKDTLVPDDYQLNKSDIVTEVEKGYIVKVNGKFYYYPNDKERKANIVTLKEARKMTKNLKLEGHHEHDDDKGSKKAAVPGIDKPTSDGFLLTDEKQITAKMDTGIVVDHDGHSHFIFYADLKGSKWEYLIPKDYKVAPNHTQTRSQQAPNQHGADDHYVFDPKDIVAEDANGYTVRHGDHYHYIPKSSLGNQKFEVPKSLNNGSQGHAANPAPLPPAGGRPGIDHPTSDDFLFDGNGIVGRTDFGLLVDHNGHTHVVPYDSLRGTRWEYLIENKPKTDQTKPNQPAPPVPPKDRPQVNPNQPKPTSPTQDNLIEAKREYLAKSLGIPLLSIRIIDTDKGQAFVYPHGDHEHAILIDNISLDKPIEDPHAHDNPHAHQAVGMATLKKLGFDDEIIQDILHARADEDFPGQETDPEKMKEWLKTVKYLNIGQRENPLERKGLELMPNIEVLGIGFTPIKDVRPLYQFKNLKHLWMTDTGIKDYSFLKNIPNLEGIDISQNGVSDLSFLKDYPNLKSVSASGNKIKDISVLAKLPKLESLNLDYNDISDISALSQLKHLEAISMEQNKLSDLSALSGKDKLKRLFLSENPGLKLESLKADKLEELTANHSEVDSLTFLKQLPSLKTLNLDENKLRSLAGLEDAKALESLSASKNQIDKLDLPADQSSLSRLNLSHNRLKDLSGINRFKSLEDVNAANNQLKTLELEEANQTIRNLDVSNNQIPKEELELNDKKIPNAIAKNFKSAESGDISGNVKEDDKQSASLDGVTDQSDETNKEKNTDKKEKAPAVLTESEKSDKEEKKDQAVTPDLSALVAEIDRLSSELELEVSQRTDLSDEQKQTYQNRLAVLVADVHQSGKTQAELEAQLANLQALRSELQGLQANTDEPMPNQEESADKDVASPEADVPTEQPSDELASPAKPDQAAPAETGAEPAAPLSEIPAETPEN